MANIIGNARKIFVNNSSGGGSDASLATRVTNLENNVLTTIYFAQISSGTSGAISIPTGATILQGELPGNLNALTSTLSGGQVTDTTPATAGGALVTATLDTSGNWTLSGTPSAYPIALIYALSITSVNWSNLTTANIIDYYNTNVITSISGTTNQIDVSTANPPVISIDSGYIGQSSITTLGTIVTGVWNGTKVGVAHGGTNLSSYAVGDIVYASGTTTLASLADVAAGSYLRSGGTSTAPLWSTLTLPNTITSTYVPFATGTNAIGSSANFTYTDGAFLILNNTAGSGNGGIAFNSSGTAKGGISTDGGSLYIYSTSGQALDLYTNAGNDLVLSCPSNTHNARFNGLINATTGIYSGNLTTTPTALIHIAAGTATASTSPLKFTSGTNLTTAEAGAMEYDGTNFFITDSTPTRHTVTTNDGTQTLTNKRVNPRVSSTTSASTVTPNSDSYDLIDITAQAAGLTIANASGTPVNGQVLVIRILDNSSPQTITWGTAYTEANGTALPSTTISGKILTMLFQYDTANTLNKWLALAISQQT